MSITLHPDFTLLQQKGTYLLAISGGRDSVALLHVLLEKGYRNIILCHLNHGLRAKESDADAEFVEGLAKELNLKSEIGYQNVARSIEDNGESMELAARNARHTFLAQCAKKYQCHNILLGHHANDQTETIIFNLCRGSSGLKGIKYSSAHNINSTDLVFLRPLINVSRSSINSYIKQNHIRYREDSSNAQAIATRNRIRNELIPLLSEIMGRDIHTTINRAAIRSEENEAALRLILKNHQLEDPQGRIFLPTFIKLPDALQRIALFQYFKKEGVSQITQDLIDRCLTMLHDSNASKVNLPKGLFFRRKEKRAFIDRNSQE